MICSRGTYARAVARDIGRDLGVGGRLESLRRDACGQFKLKDALTFDQLMNEGPDKVSASLIGLNSALSHIPEIETPLSEMVKLMKGNPVFVSRSCLHRAVSSEHPTKRLFRVVSRSGDFLILTRPEPKADEIALHPVRVFNMT
jgi:tRNA pseudouridine55 synthase